MFSFPFPPKSLILTLSCDSQLVLLFSLDAFPLPCFFKRICVTHGFGYLPGPCFRDVILDHAWGMALIG